MSNVSFTEVTLNPQHPNYPYDNSQVQNLRRISSILISKVQSKNNAMGQLMLIFPGRVEPYQITELSEIQVPIGCVGYNFVSSMGRDQELKFIFQEFV